MIEHLNWFDFVMMAVILLSIVISFFRGFVREAVSVVTWILGIVIALKYAPIMSYYIPSFVTSNTLRYVAAFIALFMLIFILGFTLNVFLKRLIDVTGLSFVDRVLGVVFGAVRGLIVAAIVLMFVGVTSLQKSAWAQHSQLAPEFSPLISWLDRFLPEQMQGVTQWVKKAN